MREIKFRWYDLLDNKMHYIDWGDITKGNGLPHYASTDYVLMQYTGLKDTNKNDVYEGDILRCYDPCTLIEYKLTVKFEHGAFGVSGFYLDTVIYGGSEVIGNIHENPEMLK